MPPDTKYYSDMKISPSTQLSRDKESLAILLKEKALGVNSVPGLLTNVSKNPVKVLYEDKGIDGEIARRKIIMSSLVEQIKGLNPNDSLPPTLIAEQPTEESTIFMTLVEKLKAALTPTPERNPDELAPR